MEQKTILTIIGVIAVFAIGYFLGNASFHNQGMTHQMPDGTMMSNNGDMQSMMHDMNQNLTGKTGDAFDQAFLQEMIVHHQGAVEMAEQVLAVSKRPELIQLAHDIIKAQTSEINMMQGWQQSWFK